MPPSDKSDETHISGVDLLKIMLRVEATCSELLKGQDILEKRMDAAVLMRRDSDAEIQANMTNFQAHKIDMDAHGGKLKASILDRIMQTGTIIIAVVALWNSWSRGDHPHENIAASADVAVHGRR